MTLALTYFTIPLATLRCGSSPYEAVHAGICCGIVSAGIGHRQVRGAAAFQELLADVQAEAASLGTPTACPPGVERELWEAVLVGTRITGARPAGFSTILSHYQQHHQRGQVYFRLRRDWGWNALQDAKHQQDPSAKPPDKPLTWREYRLLAALLSAPVNSLGFTFLGWENIQARACGYPSKAKLRAALAATPAPSPASSPHSPARPGSTQEGEGSAETPVRPGSALEGSHPLPPHCQPLSRDAIRHTLDKLEGFGFFGRCRYSKGPCGGYTAYTFRHYTRVELLAAVQTWADQKNKLKAMIAAHRAQDQEAFRAFAAASQPPAGASYPVPAAAPGVPRAIVPLPQNSPPQAPPQPAQQPQHPHPAPQPDPSQPPPPPPSQAQQPLSLEGQPPLPPSGPTPPEATPPPPPAAPAPAPVISEALASLFRKR